MLTTPIMEMNESVVLFRYHCYDNKMVMMIIIIIIIITIVIIVITIILH